MTPSLKKSSGLAACARTGSRNHTSTLTVRRMVQVRFIAGSGSVELHRIRVFLVRVGNRMKLPSEERKSTVRRQTGEEALQYRRRRLHVAPVRGWTIPVCFAPVRFGDRTCPANGSGARG